MTEECLSSQDFAHLTLFQNRSQDATSEIFLYLVSRNPLSYPQPKARLLAQPRSKARLCGSFGIFGPLIGNNGRQPLTVDARNVEDLRMMTLCKLKSCGFLQETKEFQRCNVDVSLIGNHFKAELALWSQNADALILLRRKQTFPSKQSTSDFSSQAKAVSAQNLIASARNRIPNKQHLFSSLKTFAHRDWAS